MLSKTFYHILDFKNIVVSKVSETLRGIPRKTFQWNTRGFSNFNPLTEHESGSSNPLLIRKHHFR